jgi:hypothetical protein
MAPPSHGRTPKGTARERRWRNGGLPKLTADPVSEESGLGPRLAVFRNGPEGPYWIWQMASHSADDAQLARRRLAPPAHSRAPKDLHADVTGLDNGRYRRNGPVQAYAFVYASTYESAPLDLFPDCE